MGRIKEQAIAMIQSLPDDCTYEDILYHLYVCEKIDQGLQDAEEGRVVSLETMEQRLEQWLK